MDFSFMSTECWEIFNTSNTTIFLALIPICAMVFIWTVSSKTFLMTHLMTPPLSHGSIIIFYFFVYVFSHSLLYPFGTKLILSFGWQWSFFFFFALLFLLIFRTYLPPYSNKFKYCLIGASCIEYFKDSSTLFSDFYGWGVTYSNLYSSYYTKKFLAP